MEMDESNFERAPITRSNRGDSVRRSFSLPEEEADELEKIAHERGISVSKVVRTAIETQLFLDEVDQNNGKIIIEDEAGNKSQLFPWD